MTRVGNCPPSNLKKKKLVGMLKFKKYRFVKMPTLNFVSNPKSINNYIKYPKQSKIITFTTTQITQKKANNILKAQK